MSQRGTASSHRFSRSRTPSLIALILCGGFLAYAVYFVFVVGFDTALAEYRRGLLLYGCCILALPFCGAAFALLVRAVLKRENGLVIDDEGVHDQLSFNGKIVWSNIVDVERLNPNSDSSSFALRLRDRRSYLRHGWTKSFVARGKDEIMIYAAGLSSAEEIMAAIKAGIRATESSGNNA